MDERLRFITRLLEGEKMAPLCREFGISRVKGTPLDTGVIVALLDRNERHHVQCVEGVSDLIGPLVTWEALVAEACYLLRRTPGAPEAAIKNVANGVFQTPTRLADQAGAVQKLLRKYHDVPMARSAKVRVAHRIVMKVPAVGRNDPCPCGSGRKFKKFCLGRQGSVVRLQLSEQSGCY